MTPGRPWPSGAAQALVDALDGSFAGNDVVVMAAAATAEDSAVRSSGPDLPPDARFEIGSVTKTLTGTLLAALTVDGTVRLTDRIDRWVPAGENGAITLVRLATHTAGLPKLPDPRTPAGPDRGNPYAGFTSEQAERELSRARIRTGGYQY